MITTDELYAKVESNTIDEAEKRLLNRYVEVYGIEKGLQMLSAFLAQMAENIKSDSRSLTDDDV